MAKPYRTSDPSPFFDADPSATMVTLPPPSRCDVRVRFSCCGLPTPCAVKTSACPLCEPPRPGGTVKREIGVTVICVDELLPTGNAATETDS